LKHSCLGSQSLWKFLNAVVGLDNKALALRNLKLGLSPSSAYRLWRRFCHGQSRIRSLLHQICLPPEMPNVHCPATHTIAHLAIAFGHDPCPIAAFQKRFQVSFH
jgi:hypothetical protein